MLSTLKYFFTRGSAHVILEAEMGDVEQIAEIHATSFPRPWSELEIERMLGRKDYSCYIAQRAGKPNREVSGFILFRKAGDEAEIISVAVKKSMRKKGIAGRLMGETIRALQADRLHNLFLEVSAENRAALKLYRDLGFAEKGRREGYYPAGKDSKPIPALVMALDLG